MYDANGRLSQDRNKGISGIEYNHLHLPRLIHFGLGADSLVFRYSAAGQKVAKLVYQTGQPVRRTDYLGPFQYEQDSLRFFPHAEGRVLRFANTTSGAVRYEREFTFQDHLGNLRLAYRLGQVRTYFAGLEPGDAARETQQFDSLSVSAPVAQAVGALARTGRYAARLNAGGSGPQSLGPLTQLAVQQGDTVTVTAPGYYPQPVSNNRFTFSLASFVAGLLQPPPGAPRADGRRGGLPLLSLGISAALPGLVQVGGGVPKGYVRLLVFDADSNLVGSQTQQLSQAARAGYESLQVQVIAPQDGYVSAYVGNESPADVFFDDVRVEHRQGLQVQETHYDPTGLELAGLGGTSPGLKTLSQYKWNGKEFQPDLGLNWTQLDWRMVDPQTGGGFHVVDPDVENGQESMSPYVFGYDNAVRFNDPNGRNPGGGGGATLLQAEVVGNEFMTLLQEAGPALQNAATAIGLTAALAWVGNHLPSAEQVGDVLSHAGAASAAQPGMYSPYMQMYTDGKMRASATDANGRVEARPANRTADKPKHNNKLGDQPAEGYSTRDRKTGEVRKYGETTNGERKNGPDNQKRYSKKELKEKDVDYVKEVEGTKKGMHEWQTERIREHKEANGGRRPRDNKSDY